MAYVSRNRVKESTATVGAGPLTLSGASPRYRSFAGSNIPPGSTFSYLIDVPSGPWEVGIGALAADGTVSRLLEDSSSGALLALTGEAGTTISLVLAASTVQSMLQDTDLLTLVGITSSIVKTTATPKLVNDAGSALADSSGRHLIPG